VLQCTAGGPLNEAAGRQLDRRRPWDGPARTDPPAHASTSAGANGTTECATIATRQRGRGRRQRSRRRRRR
jgi:hypothetical protein